MKRKIEAKMKARGISSQDAQQIAKDVVEENGDSQVNTPSRTDTPPIRSPESMKESHSIISSPVIHPPNSRTTEISTSNGPIAHTPKTADTDFNSIPPSYDITPMDLSPVDDDEARLLVEIEEQRQAEEQARQKLRELEDRLARARDKKFERSENLIAQKQITKDQNEVKCTPGIQQFNENR